ncbi:inositol 1,4,5-trisphosphate receptor-interacting protein-like 1 [Willisornis vidua]|uniref:Inositol 1,4,5-trisphosphate receptor-interacting protein-like 1 n=1 Tax=Willisornis vidua TaxID=1566151 RepID=A0ABQ9D8P3_9PASS|nr:inositol 1,4,5-trisphosphate receptor-interacting protein-like 1 [Willisornis vidua]
MAKAIVLLLAVLAILPEQTHDHQIDVVTAQRMKDREILLNKKMTQLWEEIEWMRFLEEAPLLVMYWLFWVADAAVLCWLIWKRKVASRRHHEWDSSSREEKDRRRAQSGITPFVELNLPPMEELPMGRTLKKLVHDLLEVCQVLSQNTFMPEMHPATGKPGTIEFWRDLGDQILYQLVVLLRPPPGHSFRLKASREMGLTVRCSDIHVVLECTCSKIMADTLCFVHPTHNNESSRLVRTLCTDSYLDGEKMTSWVQNLVESAWEHLPQWHNWELRVLPSSGSCRVLLSSPCEVQLCAVLVFAVQQGSPGTFLVLQ